MCKGKLPFIERHEKGGAWIRSSSDLFGKVMKTMFAYQGMNEAATGK